MIFLSWGFIFCMIVISSHISSNELKKLSKESTNALRSPATESGDNVEGMYETTLTYNRIGKRQTFLGALCIVWLLYMYNFQPFNGYAENVAIFISNGLVIWSLLGYTAEGLFMWNSSQNEASENASEVNNEN